MSLVLYEEVNPDLTVCLQDCDVSLGKTLDELMGGVMGGLGTAVWTSFSGTKAFTMPSIGRAL